VAQSSNHTFHVDRDCRDGCAVWVTSDRHRFSQRVIKTGLREDDRVEVREGLKPGELVVAEGAIFLSNLLQAPPSD